MTLDLRLAVSDLVVGDQPIKVKCPDRIHKERLNGKVDKTQSLAVYPDHIHCYGCDYNRRGEYGLADLLDIHPSEAFQVANKYDSASLDAYRERTAEAARTDPLPVTLATLYHNVLMSGPRKSQLDWLHARGLTNETLRTALIGHDGNRYVIPVFDGQGKLLSLRFRRDDDYLDEKYPKYVGTKGRNGLYLYPEQLIEADTRDYLVICEGELDALRLWQEHIPAVSATNGAGQAPKLPKLIYERWPRIKRLFIATDQDEPGQEAARLTELAARELGFETVLLLWKDGKDVTEAIQLGTLTIERYVARAG